MRRLKIPIVTWLAAAIAFAQTAAPVRISGSRYGFSVEVPNGWNCAVGDDGLPFFANFSWSNLQAQGILPRGGATINFIAWQGMTRRPGDETLRGWARLDAVNAAPGTLRFEPLTMPAATKISEAVLSSFSEKAYSPDEQHQHDTSIYWRFGRDQFAAHLFYVEGDPKGKDYEAVLKRAVRSSRPQ